MQEQWQPRDPTAAMFTPVLLPKFSLCGSQTLLTTTHAYLAVWIGTESGTALLGDATDGEVLEQKALRWGPLSADRTAKLYSLPRKSNGLAEIFKGPLSEPINSHNARKVGSSKIPQLFSSLIFRCLLAVVLLCGFAKPVLAGSTFRRFGGVGRGWGQLFRMFCH
jgi:hypothetical protein